MARPAQPAKDFVELADDGVELDLAVGPAAPEEAAKFDTVNAAADIGSLDWALETRTMLALALPSVVIQASLFWIWLSNAAFAGTHLGVTEMAAVSLANLAGNLTALSIQYGLIYALETLTSQAIGSGRHGEVGVLVQRCCVCCVLACIPGFALWLVMEHVLLALGQPAAVSALAARFLLLYMPGLPGMVTFEVLRRFLGCQNIVLPVVPIVALVTWLGHPLLLRLLLGAGFGFASVPCATVVSMWSLALIGLAYVAVARPHDPQTWQGLDLRRALSREGMRTFLGLAIPGVLSMSEWWFWEVCAACVGTLGEVSLAAHSIAYSIVPMLVMLPIGVSIAIATRVGQLIGEGRPRHAKMIARATVLCGMCVVATYVLAVSASSRAIISSFAPREASPVVFDATLEVWPLVSAFLVFDGFYMLLNGCVRALSLQLHASVCVLVSLWLLGLPATFIIVFRTATGLRGVWATLLAGYALLDLLCAAVVLAADWARISASVRAANPQGGGTPVGKPGALEAVPSMMADDVAMVDSKQHSAPDRGGPRLSEDARNQPA